MISEQSAAIKRVLEAMVDMDGNRIVREVVEKPTNSFESYPAACITPEETDSERATITQDQVDQSFTVMVFIPLRNDPDAAWARLRRITDLIATAIRNSDNLGGATQILLPVETGNYDEPVTGSGGNATTELTIRMRDIVNF